MSISAIEIKHDGNTFRRTDSSWYVLTLNFFGTASGKKKPTWQWTPIDESKVPKQVIQQVG